MVTSVAGLPTMPTDVSIANPDIQQKYSASIDKLLSTIENHGNTINLAKVSAAMANPGRTGHWSEGFSNAMNVIGQQREEQEKNALPIAQMRAHLAGKQYEMGLKSNALNLVGQTMRGMGAGAATGAGGNSMAALQSGNLFDPSFTQRLMSIYPVAAQDKDTGAILKEMIDQGFKLQTHILEQRKANTPEATLYAKYGAKILPLLSPEFRQSISPAASTSGTAAPVSTETTGPARPEPLDPDVVPLGTPAGRTDEELADARERGDTPRAGPVATAAPVTTPAKTEARTDGYIGVDGKFKPFPPNASFELQDELIKQNEKAITDIQKTQAEADNKFWTEQKTMIYTNGTPDVITRQKNDLDIIGNASIDRPQVLGQLAKEGLFNALANALDTGAQVGRFGQFSIPIDQFISQIALNDPDRAIKVSVAKSMARVFFDNAQLAKSVLGRFTDQDARLAQAPLASMSDPAKTVQHWVGEQLVNLEHKKNSYAAMDKWEDDNPGVSTRKFFSPNNPVYMRIVADHQARLANWLSVSPLYKTGAK